jgi:hypothetical protein
MGNPEKPQICIKYTTPDPRLSEDDWRILEYRGWIIDWQFTDSIAICAIRYGLKLEDAISEFEYITERKLTDLERAQFKSINPPNDTE